MADGTVVFNQRLLGQTVQNVMVWSNVPTDPDQLLDIADEFRADWATLVSAIMVPEWSLESITFVFNDSAPIYSVEIDFTLGTLVGTATSDPIITQGALLVSTVYVGPPPNRGRIYFAGLGEGSLVNGLWSSTAYGAFEAMVQSWAEDGVGSLATIYPRIARRDAAGIITLSSPVQQAIGQAVPATQRRRRIGSGT